MEKQKLYIYIYIYMCVCMEATPKLPQVWASKKKKCKGSVSMAPIVDPIV